MKRYIVYLLSCMYPALVVMGCAGSGSQHPVTDSDVDTLPPGNYRVEPDINDISELRSVLQTADKVVAYNFNKNNANSASVECDFLFDPGSGKLCPSAVGETQLSHSQTDSLISIVCDTSSYTGSWSGIVGACFIPHVGFGFFKNDSLIQQVNVCFLCGGLRTYPYYRSDEMSMNGGQRIGSLVRKLGLTIVDNKSQLTH